MLSAEGAESGMSWKSSPLAASHAKRLTPIGERRNTEHTFHAMRDRSRSIARHADLLGAKAGFLFLKNS